MQEGKGLGAKKEGDQLQPVSGSAITSDLVVFCNTDTPQQNIRNDKYSISRNNLSINLV